MSDTARLALPLLAPSQAQKHVTVNEALLRLDALCQLVLASRSVADPPDPDVEGTCFAVPAGAAGAWEGQAGMIAVALNGGWEYVRPGAGWRAWIADEALLAVFTGHWSPSWSTNGAGEGGVSQRSITIDHAVAAGATSATASVIPDAAFVWGVTGRVVEAIGGAPSFRLGVAGSDNRYGSGIGSGAGSWLRGLTSSPLAYWGGTPLLLTAEDGAFDGSGLVRLAVHVAELALPE